MDVQDFYRTYKPLHLHFSTDKFDCTKSKCRYGAKEIDNRNDRQLIFSWAGRLTNRKEAARICASNFAFSDYWLDNNNKDVLRRAEKWVKYKKDPRNEFLIDLENLKQVTNDRPILDLVSKTKSGQLPPILQLLQKEQVNPDFVCILDRALPFIDSQTDFWFVEGGCKRRLTKNRAFCTISEDSAKDLLLSIYQGVE